MVPGYADTGHRGSGVARRETHIPIVWRDAARGRYALTTPRTYDLGHMPAVLRPVVPRQRSPVRADVVAGDLASPGGWRGWKGSASRANKGSRQLLLCPKAAGRRVAQGSGRGTRRGGVQEGRRRRLTLVLEGNNPPFPWCPSTSMLTNRLKGTTGTPASDRGEQSSVQRKGTTTELDRRTSSRVTAPSRRRWVADQRKRGGGLGFSGWSPGHHPPVRRFRGSALGMRWELHG